MAQKPPERDHVAILTLLNEIEAEMRRINYWDDNPPPAGVIEDGTELPFALLLQTHFLPRAREAARTRVYPEGESMAGLATAQQYASQGHAPEAHRLIDLLRDFDRLVNLGR